MQPTSTSEWNPSTYHQSPERLPCTWISNGKRSSAWGPGGSCRACWSAPDLDSQGTKTNSDCSAAHTCSITKVSGCADRPYFSFCWRILWKGDCLVFILCDASYKSRREHLFKSAIRKCCFRTTVFSRIAYPHTQLKTDVHYMNTCWKNIYWNNAKAQS